MHEAMWLSEASLAVVFILTVQTRHLQHREDKGLAPRSALGIGQGGSAPALAEARTWLCPT